MSASSSPSSKASPTGGSDSASWLDAAAVEARGGVSLRSMNVEEDEADGSVAQETLASQG